MTSGGGALGSVPLPTKTTVSPLMTFLTRARPCFGRTVGAFETLAMGSVEAMVGDNPETAKEVIPS